MPINREEFNFDDKKFIKNSKLSNENLAKLFDKNADGNISSSEINSIFNQIDENLDGNITDLEIKNAMTSKFSNYRINIEEIKTFLTEALNNMFKAKGDLTKYKDEKVLLKNNGTEIIYKNDGTSIIKTPKQTEKINNDEIITYSITTKAPDGSFIVEQFKESQYYGYKTCQKYFYDSKGEETQKEQREEYAAFTIKENIKNNTHSISYNASGSLGTSGLHPHGFKYSFDSDNKIYNEKNGIKVSITPQNIEGMFDEQGNLKKDVNFPIKTEVNIEFADGSNKTLEISILNEEAIKYQSTAMQNKNSQIKLNDLYGNITDTIVNLDTDVINDLLAEINIIEIASKSQQIASGSNGEYRVGSDTIRLHTSEGGLNSSTLTHEIGHAIDDKMGEYITHSKLSDLLEDFKTTTGLNANTESSYALTNPQEFFAEWYENKYIKNKSTHTSNSEDIFNTTIENSEIFKKIDTACEELLNSIRTDSLNRKHEMIKIKEYDEKTINAFILEYYNELNNIQPIYVAKDLRIAMASNPQILEIYNKYIEDFASKFN